MLLFLKQEIRWVMVLCVDMPWLFSGARMPGWAVFKTLIVQFVFGKPKAQNTCLPLSLTSLQSEMRSLALWRSCGPG